MAYNDDAVLSKLSALNESHDSIATAAQWIMFHRRHAERTVQLWLTKMRDLPSQKRLNLIYLANEVVQQSKARQKVEFLREFSPHIAEGTQIAYKGASSDIQAKLRRVIDVWRDRQIFEPHVQDAVEAQLNELDRARNSGRVGGLSGGTVLTSSSSIPPELGPFITPQHKISKGLHPMNHAVKIANLEYEKLTDPSAPVPAPPVYAARLNGLMKTLASAEGAVAEIIRSRKELIGAMEKMLNTNREALEVEEASLNELGSRKTTIESRKQEVERAIMRSMSGHGKEQSPHEAPSGSDIPEPDRPEVEALTPPPVQDHSDLYEDSAQNGQEQPSALPQPASGPQQGGFSSAPGIEILSNLASQYHAVPVNGANKKRKIGSADDFPDLGGDDGIEADVAEMLRKDSHP